MALVDPGDDRHQFDGVDAQFLQMGDHRRVRQGRDRTALGGGHIGVAGGEALDVDFVDQAAGLEQRRLRGEIGLARGDDRARDDVGGVIAKGRKARAVGEAAVEVGGVRIDQQLGRIEPQALLGRPRAMRAITVTGAGAGALGAPPIAVARHRHAGFGAIGGEQAQVHRRRARAAHREGGARGGQRCTRWHGQVTTSGFTRPVWRAMPAMASAAAMRSASICGVSPSSLPSGGA